MRCVSCKMHQKWELTGLCVCSAFRNAPQMTLVERVPGKLPVPIGYVRFSVITAADHTDLIGCRRRRYSGCCIHLQRYSRRERKSAHFPLPLYFLTSAKSGATRRGREGRRAVLHTGPHNWQKTRLSDPEDPEMKVESLADFDSEQSFMSCGSTPEHSPHST